VVAVELILEIDDPMITNEHGSMTGEITDTMKDGRMIAVVIVLTTATTVGPMSDPLYITTITVMIIIVVLNSVVTMISGMTIATTTVDPMINSLMTTVPKTTDPIVVEIYHKLILEIPGLTTDLKLYLLQIEEDFILLQQISVLVSSRLLFNPVFYL